MDKPAVQSLKTYLLDALKQQARGKRDFEVSVLRSQPKRSYALFPWASDPSIKIYQEHLLVVLAERPEHSPPNASTSEQTAESSSHAPIFGVEIAIYTVPATSTSLLYVSKIDTTGLFATPAPSRVVTTALLQYFLEHPPHDTKFLRIHVFARSQDQYLFPGSIDNKGKRVLDDKGLCKWWRTVLGDAATKVCADKPAEATLKLHYLLGGCSYLESIPLLSAAPTPADDKAPRWVYGHPYALVPSPLPLPSDGSVMLNDLIPAFQDDPKSRYLTSLTSSPISAAGEEGDYDEVMEKLNKLSDSSETLLAMKKAEVEKQRAQERSRLRAVNVDEYWECMGGRQECCAGHVAGFFVVVRDRQEKEEESEPLPETPPKQVTPSHAVASIPYATYVRLWSAVHNVNYASMAKATEAYAKWKEDLKSAGTRTGTTSGEYDTEVFGGSKVDNPIVSNSENSLKRQEPPKAVTTLQVKKKKKVAA